MAVNAEPTTGAAFLDAADRHRLPIRAGLRRVEQLIRDAEEAV
jgi:hypothetical protein